MRVSRCWPAIILMAASPVPAEEPASPDAAFLEYLGMWDGQDEDWELFEEAPSDALPVPNVDDLGERRPEDPKEVDDEG